MPTAQLRDRVLAATLNGLGPACPSRAPHDAAGRSPRVLSVEERRDAVDQDVPYADRVREKYTAWLAQQEQQGTDFSDEGRWWLDRMVEVIAASAGITAEDLDEAPFTQRGGVDGALRDLGDQVGHLLDQLNKELTA